MQIAVRYYSRSGNTKKLAEAVAAAVGVQAEDISVPLTEKADLLFLGNSVYAANPDEAVKAFLEQNASRIGTLVNFGSSASLRSTFKKIQAIAAENHIDLCPDEFICPGSFLFLHKNRPNAADLENAANFEKKVCNQ